MSTLIDEPVRGYVPGIEFASLSGLERCRAMIDGRLPAAPVMRLSGARVVQAGHGSCTTVMPASPWFQTAAGFFSNGVTALTADFALGGAIASALPAWSFPVTSEINFTFMRPVKVGAGKLIARGRLIEAGRRQATAEAQIEDGEGRLLAHATTRCFVLATDPQPATFEPRESDVYDTPDPHERAMPPDLPIPGDLSDLTGLEVMRLLSKGDMSSPFSVMTGLFLDFDVELGRVAAEIPASPWFQSSAGTIYGGFLCWTTDLMLTAAATSTLEARTATSSLDLKVHFLRPAIADGSMLSLRSEVVHGGKGLIVCRGEILNAAGKPIVMATGSFMRRPIRDWVPVIT